MVLLALQAQANLRSDREIGVNSMQRLSTWARWIAVSAFTLFVIPLAVEFLKHMAEKVGLYDRPGEAVDTILNFFLSLAELPWLRITALILFAFGAGLWLDWFLRKLDKSHEDSRRILGANMVKLGNYLGQIKSPMQESARIKSLFASATKLGLWVPDERIFRLPPPRASHEISDYLGHVGTMLKDGNFREAKLVAKNSKAAFDKAYAQHRLP